MLIMFNVLVFMTACINHLEIFDQMTIVLIKKKITIFHHQHLTYIFKFYHSSYSTSIIS